MKCIACNRLRTLCRCVAAVAAAAVPAASAAPASAEAAAPTAQDHMWASAIPAAPAAPAVADTAAPAGSVSSDSKSAWAELTDLDLIAESFAMKEQRKNLAQQGWVFTDAEGRRRAAVKALKDIQRQHDLDLQKLQLAQEGWMISKAEDRRQAAIKALLNGPPPPPLLQSCGSREHASD